MSLFDPHKNFAYSTVATAPSPATSGTSLVVQSGDGAKFPTVPFNATVWPAGTQPTDANAEIVRVTTIATDTFTIARTQESTSARSIIIGDQIAATVTKKTLTDIENLYSVTTKTGTYAILTSDATILCDASGGTFNVTLPTAVGVAGKIYHIKKIDVTGNAVNILTTSSQTIDGLTTQSIATQYTTISVQSDGTGWNII